MKHGMKCQAPTQSENLSSPQLSFPVTLVITSRISPHSQQEKQSGCQQVSAPALSANTATSPGLIIINYYLLLLLSPPPASSRPRSQHTPSSADPGDPGVRGVLHATFLFICSWTNFQMSNNNLFSKITLQQKIAEKRY